MEFRTEVNVPHFENRISYRSGILFMGSCFAEYIGNIMRDRQFRIDINPFGVNYNPSSLARNIWTIMNGKDYTRKDLHPGKELWFSFDHHSQFSAPDPDSCLSNINSRLEYSKKHLKSTDFLILTWGTAWVYVHKKSANVVSNCHKLPASEFSRHLLTVNQVVDTYTKLLAALRQQNPDLHIILTVSPVRHWKDGPRLNSVSKSTLILAAHKLTEMLSYCNYFPSWEIAMDDLRDYRYYKADLIHPNEQMTAYIWEKFSSACLDEEAQKLLPEINKLATAARHKPFNPGSESHLEFCRKQLETIEKLTKAHPYLNLGSLKKNFKEPLKNS